ncbi:replication protein C [Ignicoccus islandicus DSM 13165]|uniref:Replication factor C large subunit n=1 Tax=Ignicoccus islandicus DSM 13165 TaxID=940295 RepID=A0A0U2WK42_9CREN|nr:replication factor C large subunit [Ignicoccus islandicus]ALU11329.1 replication protein C [Ignicoccus islandicus DSM 13165]
MGNKLPWIIKYRPKSIEEVVDQEKAKEVLIPWIQKWLQGSIPDKKAALLWGPPGTGKTSLVEAIANEYNLEKIELNASDFRRKSDIERIAIVAATKKPLPPKRGRIVLLDEVDGLSPRGDEGAITAILELVKKARNPVIMTANDPWGQHLRPLRDVCLLVEFKRIPKTKALPYLMKICEAEGIFCEKEALSYIWEKNRGDLRACINDMQSIAEAFGKITLELVKTMIVERDRELTPWEMLQALFYAKYAWQAKKAITSVDLDYDTLFLWIAENVPRQYGDDPEDLWRGVEALSRADVYYGRIKRKLQWNLLPYFFEALGPGVALAKEKYHRRAKWSYPEKLVLLARTKEERRIREELASLLSRTEHVSKNYVKAELIPLLKFIAEKNPSYFAKLALGLRLTDEMIKYLSRKNYKLIIEYKEKLLKELEETTKSRKSQETRGKVDESESKTPLKETASGERKETGKESKGKKSDKSKKSKTGGLSLLDFIRKD